MTTSLDSQTPKNIGCPIHRAFLAGWVGNHKTPHFEDTGCPAHRTFFVRWAGYDTLIFFILFFCLSAHSQQPIAHDLAQRVDRHYNQLHSLKAQFTESYEGLGRSRTESGTLLLQKPGRMRWDYSSPAGKLFLLDGKYAWFYTKGDPQVQRIEAKKLDDLRSPLRFLLGHTQLEKEIDHLTASPGSNGTLTLTGIPHNQEKRIQRLTLAITPEGVITGIEIVETDGATTRFTFTGEQTNVPIPPSTFHFTAPPGVPVVDAMAPA